VLSPKSPNSRGAREVVVVLQDGSYRKFTTPNDGTMAVVPAASVIDPWLAANTETSIDFVHGEAAVRDALRSPKDVGVLLPPIDKTAFVSTLRKGGVMPRKSFSMGEAEEKRFYVEARCIRP